jgi:hypothetical protein
MGARTVAGETVTEPIRSVVGTTRVVLGRKSPNASAFSEDAELSQNFRMSLESFQKRPPGLKPDKSIRLNAALKGRSSTAGESLAPCQVILVDRQAKAPA